MANPTTNLNITLPEPAAESSRGTWGTTINDAIQSLDTAIEERGVPSGGTDDQILTKNGTTDYATEWATRLSSVAVTGSDGIEVDSGSPLTANGTIALGVNKSTMLTFLNAEDGATADQTNAEIKTAYEANSDTNALTDALQTKLNAIESSATADQTGAEIKTLYEAESNSFTDAQFTKLAAISGTNTGDQTLPTDFVSKASGGTFSGAVTLPSPVLNTGVSGSAVLDSDTMSGASATTLSSSESIKAYVDSQTHEAGDVTSVVAGSGLTGGGVTGDVTLNVIGGTGIDANADDIAIDATVATLTGSQTLTNKTLTAPLLGTPTSGVMTNVTGTAASLTAGTATNATNVTVAAELIISSQAVSHQLNVNSTVLFSCASHGLAENQPITFTLGTNPPDGVTSGTIYYVRPGLSGSFSGGLTGTANTFTLGTSPGGGIGNISTTSWNGASSHVFNKVRFPLFALAPTGDLPAKSGGGLTLTAEGKLTSTTFAGDLTGDVTGALTGNADTVTTNANLTGDVTSSGNATTIADGKVNEAKLHVSNTPTDGYVLTARSAAAGDMTWEASGGSFEPLGTAVAMSIALGIVLIPLLG